MEFHQKISMPNYQKINTMVKRRKDQKLRSRNFDAGHGRNESGAVVESPTMRHVSRTHRVALDWLFDMTNLDP